MLTNTNFTTQLVNMVSLCAGFQGLQGQGACRSGIYSKEFFIRAFRVPMFFTINTLPSAHAGCY